jgi:transcriptional regulator with XRE-family HTH domain
MSERGNAVSEIVAQLVTEARRHEGLSADELAGLAGLHPEYLSLLERRARQPTLAAASSLADALGLSLAELVAEAEHEAGNGGTPEVELVPAPPRRQADRGLLGDCSRLTQVTGLTGANIARAIDIAYHKLDLIDDQLHRTGARPLGALTGTGELSSLLADLLGAGIAEASAGLYVHNGPDQAPDLLPMRQGLPELELRTALETGLPAGAADRTGVYLVFRYVLVDRGGTFVRGKESRGDVAAVWEARFGELGEEAFGRRAGSASGNARLRKAALERMELVYYDPARLPYAKATGAYAEPAPSE